MEAANPFPLGLFLGGPSHLSKNKSVKTRADGYVVRVFRPVKVTILTLAFRVYLDVIITSKSAEKKSEKTVDVVVERKESLFYISSPAKQAKMC